MDQLSVQSLFTEEANKEAKEFLYSKMSFVNINGGCFKSLANVNFIGLYLWTRARYLNQINN